GYICVGWDDVGDLEQFESRAQFQERFAEMFGTRYKEHAPTLAKKANEVWTLRELEPGDLVVANQGKSRVLAVGKVVEPGYAFRPERQEHKHTVAVEWDTTYAK